MLLEFRISKKKKKEFFTTDEDLGETKGMAQRGWIEEYLSEIGKSHPEEKNREKDSK